jgi:DNA-binding response OmpR family regulator
MPEEQGDGAELAGLRILVVENEFLIADQSATALAARGAVVVGPVQSAERARAAIEAETPGGLAAAVLDVTLADGSAAPVGAALRARGVPFVIVTGHTEPSEPELRAAPVLQKPVREDELVRAVARIARRGEPPASSYGFPENHSRLKR